MARRASSSIHPGIIIGVVAFVAGAIAVGKWIGSQKKSAFPTGKELDIQQFLENGNMLSGNEYTLKGEVDEKLQWTSTRGQLVSVRVQTPGGDAFIGITIPQEFSHHNIDTKQTYHFRVKFQRGGVAVATGIERL